MSCAGVQKFYPSRKIIVVCIFKCTQIVFKIFLSRFANIYFFIWLFLNL